MYKLIKNKYMVKLHQTKTYSPPFSITMSAAKETNGQPKFQVKWNHQEDW